MGEVIYNKVQYGLEAPTNGSAGGVAATNQWPGTIRVPGDIPRTFSEVPTGTRARTIVSAQHEQVVDGWTLTMPTGFFQKLPFIFNNFLKGSVSGSPLTGTFTDYNWNFTPSLTAANNPQSATIEYGDNTQAYEINWSLARRVRISGNLGAGEPVSIEVEGFAQKRTVTTFTAGIVQAGSALEVMSADLTNFYIDSTWATSGCTVKTDILRSYDIELTNGIGYYYTATGSRTFNNTREGYLDATWTLTFEGQGTAITELSNSTAGSARQLCLDIIGSTIASTTNTHKLRVESYGAWDQIIPLSSEQDGNNLYAAVFHAYSNGSGTPSEVAVKVVTNVNAV